MIRKLGLWKLLNLVLLLVVSVTAQERKPPVSTVFAVLQNTLDTKTSAKGDETILITLNDVITDNQVVIPKGSRLVGRVVGVLERGKDEPKSVLAIAIDKAIGVSGREIPLQAIIAAVAAPREELTSDPTYAMMHSNEPKMAGSARAASGSGTLSASSKANSNAAVATAELRGRMDQALVLSEESQGAVGYDDLSITWHLALPPPITIFSTKAKNLKLKAGSQTLVRMAEPRLPK